MIVKNICLNNLFRKFIINNKIINKLKFFLFLQICVSIETKGPHESDIRNFILNDGLKFVRLQCKTYIRELKHEFSKGLILPTKNSNNTQTDSTKPKITSIVNKKVFQNEVYLFFFFIFFSLFK